jgi:RecA/RadA recombinase
MAKKKQTEEVVEDSGKSEVSIILKDIRKKYGDIIKTGTQIIEAKKNLKTISVSPILDVQLKGGIREGTWLMLSGAQKSGKAQPLSSIVYTPIGPTRMKDLQVGNIICGDKGPTKVIGIYPQGEKVVYEVSFSDGTKVKCDAGHLWFVKKNYDSCDIWETKTTEQILQHISYSDRDRWCIPVCSVEFYSKEVPLNPYAMGVLLADGVLDKTVPEVNIGPTHVKEEFREIISEYSLYVNGDGQIINNPDNLPTSNYISYVLKSLGLNVSRKQFKIPEIYKYNSLPCRMNLLRGILSANGSQHKNGYIEYNCANEEFAQDLVEVSRSCGFFTTFNINDGICKVVINTDNPGDLLGREKSVTTKKKITKTISSIVEVGREFCQCIEVDSASGLYITDGLNVTHNTTTAMQIAFNCQQEGRPIIYINAEGRLSEMNFDVEGLDPEKMIIITAEDEPISAEVFLEITLKLISAKENEGALCIIDSVSSLTASKELDEDVTGSMRPGLPKILSNFVKKAGQIVPNNKITMVMITHMITNTSGYGPSKMADCGVKIQYQADTRLEVKSISPWMEGETNQIGQAVNWKIHYSSMGATGVECQSWIRYGKGIDKTQELLILGEEMGLISKAGAWYNCEYLRDDPSFLSMFPGKDPEKFCKFQGQEKLYNFLDQNEPALTLLNNKIRELLS